MIATERELTLQSAAAATGNGTPLNVAGFHTVTAQVTGTFTATITWEGTLDNANWIALDALNRLTGAVLTTATAAGIYHIPVSGLQHFRARVSAYTDGAVTVLARTMVPSIPLALPPKQDSYGRGTFTWPTSLATYTGWSSAPVCATVEGSTTGRPVAVLPWVYNGVTHDAVRNNEELTVLAAGARSSSANSSDQINYNARGVICWFSITAVPGVDTVQFEIHAKDPIAGTYETLVQGGALAATGALCYICYPGCGAAAQGVDAISAYPLPRTWRVHITHSGAGEFTYSVGACYIL